MADERENTWLGRLRRGLGKTRDNLMGKVREAIGSRKHVDDDLFDELEAALIQADVGVETTMELIDALREKVRLQRVREASEVPTLLQEAMVAALKAGRLTTTPSQDGPLAIVAVGVNGSGKTTTLGKLAVRFAAEGRKVVIGAGDTFRAAAIDQLSIWADRAGADLVAHQEGGDPAAVAFDAVQAAKAREADVLLLDTAGRLQTKTNLMRELNKVYRVVERELGRSPDETLLVLDGTTGQNALSQASSFKEAVGLTGVCVTKLDGAAKGGIVLAVSRQLDLPIKLIGVGEGVDDLNDFDPRAFVEAIVRHDSPLDNG